MRSAISGPREGGSDVNKTIRSRSLAIGLLMVFAGATVGCSGPGPSTTAASQSLVPSSPSSSETVGAIAVPTMDLGLENVLEKGPVVGSAVVGEVHMTPGRWWIIVDCRGRGTMDISADPLVTFGTNCTTECGGGSVSANVPLALASASPCVMPDDAGHTRNRFDLLQDHDVTIAVETTDSVEWALLVESCPLNAPTDGQSQWCSD